MRKEYNDRVSAQLVNPGMTMAEYETFRSIEKPWLYCTPDKPCSLCISHERSINKQ